MPCSSEWSLLTFHRSGPDAGTIFPPPAFGPRNAARSGGAVSFAEARQHPFVRPLLVVLSTAYVVCTWMLAHRKLMWNDELYTYYIACLPSIHDVIGALTAGGEQTCEPHGHLRHVRRSLLSEIQDVDIRWNQRQVVPTPFHDAERRPESPSVEPLQEEGELAFGAPAHQGCDEREDVNPAGHRSGTGPIRGEGPRGGGRILGGVR